MWNKIIFIGVFAATWVSSSFGEYFEYQYWNIAPPKSETKGIVRIDDEQMANELKVIFSLYENACAGNEYKGQFADCVMKIRSHITPYFEPNELKSLKFGLLDSVRRHVVEDAAVEYVLTIAVNVKDDLRRPVVFVHKWNFSLQRNSWEIIKIN